jgi:glycosyltransferase involved in cell wall biosynthesis
LLERCLAVVGLTRFVTVRARRALAGRPVLQLPHHLALPLDPVPTREQARRALGLPPAAFVVTAPGLATASKRLDVAVRAFARARGQREARLVIAGGLEAGLPLSAWAQAAGVADSLLVAGRVTLADFIRHIAAADVILALRFPSHGEVSGALVRALGIGRPTLVTAGTPTAEEFPEGVVVPIDPGPAEEDHLVAVLDRLLADADLGSRLGDQAREYVASRHRLAGSTAELDAFLQDVARDRERLRGAVEEQRLPEEGLAGDLVHELRRAALDVGLPGLPADVRQLALELAAWER